MAATQWHVYLLECGDGSLYCGVTTDPRRRLAEHAAGRGARYTRGRGPLRLVWTEAHASRGGALSREAEIKAWPRTRKRGLVDANDGGAAAGEPVA